MGIVRVAGFSVSLDGFGAGLDQSLENPMGVRGMELHTWILQTRMFKTMVGGEGGSTGIDNDFAEKSRDNVGAWIMGRNMFGPVGASGPMNPGKAGGAITRRFTPMCLC